MTTRDEDRYNRAAHAMQTGVAFESELDPGQLAPKHLRAGVNSAQVSAAALAGLLIAKGVFTLEEYTAAQADQMEAEAEAYRARIQERLGDGTTVTLA